MGIIIGGDMNEETLPKIVVYPRFRSIKDQLLDSFKLIYQHWAPLLISQAILFFAVGFIVVASILIFAFPIVMNVVQGVDIEEILYSLLYGPLYVLIAVIAVPSYLIYAWVMSVMISAFGHKGEGMAPIGKSMKKGFCLFIPIAILMFLYSAALFGSSFLLFFPAVILWVALTPVFYIKVLEDVSIFKAIGTSWQITKGYRWSIFGRSLLIVLISWFISAILAFGGMVPIFGFVANLAGFAINFVMAPYILAYFYFIYADLREVRRDTYSMSTGLTILLIVSWFISLCFIAGVFLALSYAITNYLI